MNIYDEALQELDKVWNIMGLDYISVTIKALERAKKVEELCVIQEEYIQALIFDRPYTQEKCVKKIKEIKKEIEVLK